MIFEMLGAPAGWVQAKRLGIFKYQIMRTFTKKIIQIISYICISSTIGAK